MTPPDDEIAWIFEAHGKALLLYARQWVDAASAEDVVQKAFTQMLTSGKRPAEPRAWLFRCVRNEAISEWRSNQRRIRRQRAVAKDRGEWFIPGDEDRIDASLAQVALETLPPIQREVVTLRLWSGLTLAEIASVIGIGVSSVHGHYRDALVALRAKLEMPCRKSND